jgi:hypothetical protein
MEKDEITYKLELAEIMVDHLEKDASSSEDDLGDKPTVSAFKNIKRYIVKTGHFFRWCIKTNLINTKSIFDLTWQILALAGTLGYDAYDDGFLSMFITGLKAGYNALPRGGPMRRNNLLTKTFNALRQAIFNTNYDAGQLFMFAFYVFAFLIILPNIAKKWNKMPDKITLNLSNSKSKSTKLQKKTKTKTKKSITKSHKKPSKQSKSHVRSKSAKKKKSDSIPRGSRCPSKYPNYCKHWSKTKNKCIKTNECIDHLSYKTYEGTRKSPGIGEKFMGDKW